MTHDPMPRWLLAVICVGAAVVLWPFAPWVVLALWLGLFARRVHGPMTKVFGGRRGIAASVTVLLLLIFVIPLGAMIGSLVVDAIELVRGLMDSEQGQSVLVRLVQGDRTTGSQLTSEALTSTQGITDLVMRQGDRAWLIARQVAGAAAHGLIGLLVLVTGMYGVLVDGRAWYAWVEQHAPVPASSLGRLAAAFVETGRGLAVGIVGAGALQALVATIAYVALGVPQALALGMLTLIFSVVPAIGTALVWLPVAAGLILTGQEAGGITLLVIGVAVIGTIDNVARPYLARRGKLMLPTYVVLLAMFGGIEIMGAWGLMLGPLIVRLAKEALVIRTESVTQPVTPS